MSDTTLIAWTDRTWNPWRGCRNISAGCAHCYMFAGQSRWGRDPHTVVRCGRSVWRKPYAWQAAAAERAEPTRVFTCSWSDWFISDADGWRPEAWNVIRDTPDLIYQVLTKRADRIADHLPPGWGDGWPNVWLGVSIESATYTHRADTLREIPAAVRFVSYEPALGPLADSLDLTDLHWMIYGGESGPRYRREDKQWARDMRDACREAGVAFFHKQSAASHTERGVELDGEIIHEFPHLYAGQITATELASEGNESAALARAALGGD